MIDQAKLDDLLDIWEDERERGEEPSPSDLCKDCPELIEELTSQIRALKATDWLLESDDDDDDDFLSLPPELTKKPFTVPSSVTLDQFTSGLIESGLLTAEELEQWKSEDANQLASELIRAKKLTEYQAEQICDGNTKGLVMGNYVILDKIGAGGMGQVFKARHKRMDRVVALKLLPESALESETAVERFHREVKAAARLEHPNIVTAHDADEFDGQHFLVMQYVEGEDLSSLVKSRGRMPVGKAVDCVIQAAKGLEYAHGEGIVHRDIKPANLLLNKKGVVKILDMGLARLEKTNGGGFSATQAELTSEGMVLGTIDYLAPEQALDTHQADARADIYSLGCTLYYLLTATPIYSGSTLMAKMLAHRETEIPSLCVERDDVPEDLDALFQNMVEKEPENRHTTMTECLGELERLAEKYTDTWQHEYDVEEGKESLDSVESKDDIHSKDTSSAGLGDTLATKPSATPDVAPSPAPQVGGNRKRLFVGGIAALLLIGLLGYWLFGVILKIDTGNGIIQIESSHPDVEVFVDNQKVVYVTDPKDKSTIKVEIPKGAKTLRVTKAGFEADVPEFKLKTVKGLVKVSFVAVGEKESVAGDDGDKQIAEFVFSLEGGYVANDEGDRHTIIKRLGDWPDKFQFGWVILNKGEGATEADVLALCTFLSKNPSPPWVSFDGGFTDNELRHVERIEHLRVLRFYHCGGITDDTLVRLAQIKDLENLGLHWCGNITGQRFDAMSQLTHLKRLYLNGTPIQGSALEHLSQLKLLEQLHLGANRNIADDNLRHLSTLTSLRTLGLGATGVTDDGLQYLSSLEDLHDLSLADTTVGDDGLEHLKGLKELSQLNLNKTKVTAQGVAELQKALPDCKIEWDEPATPE